MSTVEGHRLYALVGEQPFTPRSGCSPADANQPTTGKRRGTASHARSTHDDGAPGINGSNAPPSRPPPDRIA